MTKASLRERVRVTTSTLAAEVAGLKSSMKHEKSANDGPLHAIAKASPDTPASQAKTVRFSDEPATPQKFDPGEPPHLLNAAFSGEWSPLTQQAGKPWRTSYGSSVAQGGNKVFSAVSANDWWTLQPGFLNRFKSVQSYEQQRMTDAATQNLFLDGGQVGYGTAMYKIDLRPTTIIQAEHIGILQDPLSMGMKVPRIAHFTSMRLCWVFGAFEKVEKVCFRNVKIPKTVVPASMRPIRWPATRSEKRLEDWIQKTWPRQTREDR